MNIAGLAEEIVDTYSKHGWTVSRVLHSGSGTELDNCPSLTGIPRQAADFDAIWFERPAKNDLDAVELRLLSTNPFALFELIERGCSEEERSQKILAIERRMGEYASKPVSGNGA